jgi:hypothetical protein
MSELVQRLRGPMGCSIAAIERKCREAADRIETLEFALRHIADPIVGMQRWADGEGRVLHGSIAVSLSNDADYLKQVARVALKEDSHE